MKKCIKRICCFILCLLIAGAPITVNAIAADDGCKTVRVGYYSGDYRLQDGYNDNVRKTGYAYEYYQELSVFTGWKYEYIYGTKSEIFDLIAADEVDIIAGVYKTDTRSKDLLFSEKDMGFEGEPRYFAISPDREDLLIELNNAQKKLLDYSPDFEMNLLQKYYTNNSQQALTEEERAWLKEKGSLNIGYIKGNLPISDQTDDQTPTGVAKELFEEFSSFLDIKIEPICYNTVKEMEAALGKGEIDAAFPVYSNLWLTENKGFFQTDSIVSDRIMIVYKGNYRDDIMKKIALSETGADHSYYISSNYPQSEIIYYDSRTEAFEALEKGDAGCVMGFSVILQRFMAENTQYQNFHVAYLDTSGKFRMAVNHKDNVLVVILNKAIRQFDSTDITRALIQYSTVDATYSLREFIQHYSLVLIAVLSALFLFLLFLFIHFGRKEARFKNELNKNYHALEDALNTANIASAAKTTFLSNMSHDIRTPMNGIIGMTAIAAANIDNTAKVKDCLEKITSSGRHLLALINDILDMSKIESGEIHLNDDFIDLSVLLNDLINLNKPLADAKNQEMLLNVENLSHEKVIGDNLRIQQVFTNLVSNAVKYTHNEGKIQITLSERPTHKTSLGCFKFTVKDNGIGMSPDYLPHVFETFSRADNTNVNAEQGTGLGLAIANNIVQMMDGDISVKSELGVGSEFTVTLYLKLADAELPTYKSFENLNVLVVDDDCNVCESTCLVLSELGIQSEWVKSGREAVEKISANYENGNKYSAVLIDWKMPDMDGVTAVRKIRECIGDDLFIIIDSAYDWSAIENEAILAGANGFIGKPLFKSRLVHVFEQLLDNKKDTNAPGVEEQITQSDFTGKHALIAEDNEINAEIAIEILGMTGITVDWAHNGREAVEKLNSSDSGYYDCIFMDIQMPVLNGIDAAKEIRQLSHPDAKDIPIFAMTANAFADDVQTVLNAGMNEHIAKPLDFEILIKILNKYLKSN